MFDRLRRTGRRAAVLALTALFLAWGMAPAEARRLALIVGNSDYSAITPLRNAINDAEAMSDALARLGFEVTLLTDVDSADFWLRLDEFSARAKDAESTLFFYSGHAFQMGGVNYLVPVGAQLSSREAIERETWNLDGIIARLQNRNRQTLIFLDACRNDPLPSAVRGTGAAADGLARVQTGAGTFVAFATAPGAVTFDGAAEAQNSPFTAALLEHIETEGLSVSDLMIKVRNDVEQRTFRRQTPWDQSSLRSQFYFKPVEERQQLLSAADFEQLALYSPEDRQRFLDMMRASGFSAQMIRDAQAAIDAALENLEIAEDDGLLIGDSDVAELSPGLNEDELGDLPVAEDDGLLIGGEAVAGAVVAPDPEVPEQLAAAPTPPATPAAPAIPAAPVATLSVPAEPRPAPPSVGGEPLPEVIRLAALDGATRSLTDIGAASVSRPRLEGRELLPDSDEARALLAAIDPSLVEEVRPDDLPDNIVMAVQAELRRLGCYTMRVDGQWGNGSRTALTSYYLAKRMIPDALDPTEEVWRRLVAEQQVVCEVRVARTPPASATTTRRSTPTATAAPQPNRPAAGGGTRTQRAPVQAAPETTQSLRRSLRGTTF